MPETQQLGARRRRRRRVLIVVLVACLLVAAGVVVAITVNRSSNHSANGPGPDDRPNIVFVLTDDLSSNLDKYMPQVAKLARDGMTFTNYTVTDSYCCPSRASIFTGDFPHNTHVVTNTLPDGGFDKFTDEHLDDSTFATTLSAAGYDTGFIGKYLNGYQPKEHATVAGKKISGAYVPPGWTTWDGVNGGGYNGYNYAMAVGAKIRHYGTSPADYMTTVAQERGEKFIRTAASKKAPFFLEVATFAPHPPYVPAPKDIGTFNRVKAPRDPSFGRLPTNPPAWLAHHAALDALQQTNIDRGFHKRVESVQAVNRMIAALRGTLAQVGQSKNTVFIFSSDNGFHMGEHGLQPGKQTAFDTDVLVPLVVAGPGIAAGSTSADVTENIDLRPTFEQLAGAKTPNTVDGHSLVPLLHGQQPQWRTIAGIEHVKAPPSPADPDSQDVGAGVPPSYDAIRTATYTYVRYKDGDREYYDRAKDPYENDNLGHQLTAARIKALDGTLDGLLACHGPTSCWDAADPVSR